MKKLRTKITREFLSPAYSSPTETLETWPVVRQSILDKYEKKIAAKVKKKHALSWLDVCAREYVQAKIISEQNNSTLGVLKARNVYLYRRWLSENFPGDETSELLQAAEQDWYYQLFGVIKTMAMMSRASYPFALIKSDFKNYRLHKYQNIDVTALIQATASGRYPITPELNAAWNEIIGRKYGCPLESVPDLEVDDIPKFSHYLARVKLFIRLGSTLSPGVVKELLAIQTEAARLHLPLDYSRLIRDQKFP